MEIKNGIIAIPPGESIKEQLDDRAMSQTEFAERMGYTTKFISELINGKVPLSHQTALRLERVLGIPARFWNNLEALYQEDLARIKQEIELESELSIAELIPYSEMAKKKWIQTTKIPRERVELLRRYYSVASLKHVKKLNKLCAVFRKVDHGKASEYALSAWMQKGFIEARELTTKSFNKKKLDSNLTKIRSFINEDPAFFQPKLIELLADCGVALVFLPHLKNTYAHGATTWENKNKAIIILSLRGKDADKFWFSLFHEIGHLILHGKDNTFIQYDDMTAHDNRETEADLFASNILIPAIAYHNFIEMADFSEQSISIFASFISIHPGIVVGRLQHDQIIGFNQLNHMKQKYEWTEANFQ
jgi:HTH-type transcriptional regulator/antitoxin HigA